VIEPLHSDRAFLNDVTAAASREPKAYHLWWIGQSGFLLYGRYEFTLIDPYLSESLTAKYAVTSQPHVRISRRVVDPKRLDFLFLVLSTHQHTDHLDAETLRPLFEANPVAHFVVPAAIEAVASERSNGHGAIGLDDGKRVQLGLVCATGVAAAHPMVEYDVQGRCKCLGYVLDYDGFVVYHSGDTVVYDGMVERLRSFNVDIAILPINGKVGNMSGADAAHLAEAIGAKLVIPCHYDMFEFNTADPYAEFVPECERLGQPYRVLKLGERWSSTELNHR
jgi:L-ascorbate metabolism protein UlaG (beta-lactamase superfamily)